MTRFAKHLLLWPLAVLLVTALVAVAQDDAGDEGENSFIIGLIERQISAPGREVGLRGIQGALSSRARIAEITLSDDEGVWLRIEGAVIDWSRAQLLLGRINVNSLSAERIAYLRPGVTPPPETALPTPEARPFQVPELPISLNLRRFEVGTLYLGPTVLGQEASLSVEGALNLAGGALDASLAMERQDGVGGLLDLVAAFSNQTRLLELDLRLQEPEGGLVATALSIEGRPAIDLAVAGSGPLEDLDVTLGLDAAGERLVAGDLALRGTEAGLAFTGDLGGALAPLVPAEYRPFFAGDVRLQVDGINRDSGGLLLNSFAIRGDTIDLAGDLDLAPGGFPQAINLSGRLGDPRGDSILLPVPGGQTRMHSAALEVQFGAGRRWIGYMAIDRFVQGEIEIEDITLSMGGLAENLADPATRNLSVQLEGLATGLWAEDPELRRALGRRVDFFTDLALPPDGPIDLRQLQISGSGLSIFTAGVVEDLVYSGRSSIRIADLAPFGGLAGQDLAGAIDVIATGDVDIASGGFALTLDGGTTDIVIGDPRVDRLLEGQTVLSGLLARDSTGIRTDDFSLGNERIRLQSTGRYSSVETDILVDLFLSDLALVTDAATGAVTVSGSAQGLAGPLDLDLRVALPEGSVDGRPITEADFGFAGTLTDGNLLGRLDGRATFDAQPIALAGEIGLIGETQLVRGLDLLIGPNRVTGDIRRTADRPVEGQIALTAPDLAPVAALAAIEAAGSVEARITLGPDAAGGQALDIAATGRGLEVPGAQLDAFDVTAQVIDALGLPFVDGNLQATGIAAGGFDVTRLVASASQTDAERMAVAAEASLAIGTEIALAGGLARLPGGLEIALERLTLTQDQIAARLLQPATVTLQDGAVALSRLILDLGAGRLEAEGRVDDRLDLDLLVEALPLALANTIRPELGLDGIIDATARVTGTLDSPDAAFDLDARGLTAAALQDRGLPALNAVATGRTTAEILSLTADLTAAGGLAARVAGDVPLGDGAFDLELSLQALPLALADPLAGGLGLGGTLAGSGRLTGSAADPTVRFDLTGSGLAADPLRAAGIAALDAAVRGVFGDNALQLDQLSVTGPQGLAVSAAGRVPLDGGAVDLAWSLDSLPLAIADQAAGGLGLGGTVTGQGRVSGDLTNPTASFDVAGSGLTAQPLRDAGIASLNLTAAGSLADQVVTLSQATVTGPQGLQAGASGTVPLDGRPMALDWTLGNLPLGLLDQAAGGQGLGGTLTGSGTVSGALDDPAASFAISGGTVTARALREAGIPAVAIEAAGSFANQALTLTSASVSGPQGLSASASGTVPLTGAGLNVSVTASLPLALANQQLADRGTQFAGTAQVQARVGGSLADPAPAGSISISGATIVDGAANIRLESVALDAAIQPQSISINTLSANVAGGGSIIGGGSVGLDPAQGFPADLSVTIDDLRYTDGRVLSTRLSAGLGLTGPLTGGATLGGTINLGSTEVSIAEGFAAGAGAAAIDAIQHRLPPRGVERTLQRAGVGAEPPPPPAAGSGAITLALTINAPNQIFVRGRGLDVELGGSVEIVGTTADIQPIGAFQLIRGRLSVLGQRITFDEGELRLIGTLDPDLLFIARTVSDDITAMVTVQGRASAPEIIFSSQPELPQDEVLARIIFNRSAEQLSPFQLAQLAAAAAELAGQGGNGLLSQFRGAIGLDDLDIITEDDGSTAVRAGRYIQDNVYLDLQASSDGTTRARINLDITDSLTARGQVDTEGNTGIGIFFERDY